MWSLREKQARFFLGTTMLAAAVLLFTGVHEDRSNRTERKLTSYAVKTVGLHYYVKAREQLKAQQEQAEQENNDTYIVLLTCSAGYFDMFVNWLQHFELLSISNLPVYMFADTSDLYQQCLSLAESNPKKKEYLKCRLWDFAIEHSSSSGSQQQQDVMIDNDEYSTLSSYNHQFMTQQQPAIIHHLLQQQNEDEGGYNVIYSDLDIIWKKNPLPHIQKVLHQHDHDGHVPQHSHQSNVHAQEEGTTTNNEEQGTDSSVDDVGPHILACRADGQQAFGQQLSTNFVIYKSSHPGTLDFVNLWKHQKMPADMDAPTKTVSPASGRTNLSVTFNTLLDQIDSSVINYVNVHAETLSDKWCSHHLNKIRMASLWGQPRMATAVVASGDNNMMMRVGKEEGDEEEGTAEKEGEEGLLREKVGAPRGRIGGGSWM